MEMEQFVSSLNQQDPPIAISVYLQALWYDGKDDWHKAHNIIQDIDDKKAAWVHAYLHRKEGDVGNARYWYTRAGKTFPSLSLQQEWENITEAFL